MSVARSSGDVSAASARRSRRPSPSRSAAGARPSGRASAGGLMTKMCFSCGSSSRTFEDPLQEAGVLHHGDLGLGVTGQVLDLLGRRRVVDAHRGGPQELGRGVEPVEVRPVAHHQEHPLTGLEPVVAQAGGGLGDQVGVLGRRPLVPRAGGLAPHGAQHHQIRMGVHDGQEARRAWSAPPPPGDLVRPAPRSGWSSCRTPPLIPATLGAGPRFRILAARHARWRP